MMRIQLVFAGTLAAASLFVSPASHAASLAGLTTPLSNTLNLVQTPFGRLGLVRILDIPGGRNALGKIPIIPELNATQGLRIVGSVSPALNVQNLRLPGL